MAPITDVLLDTKRLRLIATALELMQYERRDSAVILIPGTDPQRYVTVGTAATVAQLLEIAPAAAAELSAASDLPALPLDLDKSPARMSIHIKAGELAELIRRWGREVYASAQKAAPEAPGSEQQYDLVGNLKLALQRIKASSFLVDARGYADVGLALIEVQGKHTLAATTASPRCTCPSGDGSLRWPCPTHPPEATTASASARTELVELLKAIRPNYGSAGSRDVDVAAQQQRIDRAIELLSVSAGAQKGGAA